MHLDLIVIPHSHGTGFPAIRQSISMTPVIKKTHHSRWCDRARFYVLQGSGVLYRTSEKKIPAMHITAKTAIEIFMPSMNAG